MRSNGRMILACAVGVILLSGCTRSMMEDSAADLWPAPEDELDFWDELETRRTLTNHDALHGLLLAEDPNAAYESYEARAAAAVERGWLDDGQIPPANESAEIGTVAVAACVMLDIRGGLTMSILGPSPRSSTRELVYLGILPERSPNQAITGLEFMDLLRKIDSRSQEIPEFMLDPSGPDDAGTPVADDGGDGAETPDEPRNNPAEDTDTADEEVDD